MLNCNTLSRSSECFYNFKNLSEFKWGIYPNLGESDPEIDGKIDRMNSDKMFEESIVKYLNERPFVVGSCCGSSPKHTKIIKRIVDEIN